MRRPRKTAESSLVLAGLGMVLVPVGLADGSPLQAGAVLAGLVLLFAGVRQLSRHVLPEERRFLALRRMVDDFRDDVRRLNQLVVEGRQGEAEALRRRLHEQVDALVEAAGRETDADPHAGDSREPPRDPARADARTVAGEGEEG